MALVSKLLGATALICTFGTSVQAQTLASANAFACGVDAPSAYGTPQSQSSRAAYGGYPGAGIDAQMPSMVKLRIVYEYPDRIEIDHCGGTVIDSQWVVTAAHCVAADSSWDRVEVIAGDTNLDSGNVVRRVSRDAVCHSGFEFDGLKDDVALIKLDNPLPAHIPPAQIDQQNYTSARRGSTALVAGWPVTGGNKGDRRLNKTQVQLTDVQVPGYVTAVSASGGAEGVCRGESGGPLMTYGSYGLTLAGVLSGIQPGTENGQGDECMLSGYEMYFTPIAAFRGWMDNVRALCSSNPAMCSGGGARGMMLANAPAYNGSSPSYESSPAYVQAPAQPTYTPVATQPTYVSVAQTQPTYVPVAQAQPTYTVAQTQPTYVPVTQTQPTYTVAQTQPTYLPVAQAQPTYTVAQTQPTYVDVSNQYAPYNGGYSVQTQPVYQDVTYQVALNDTAPIVDYSTSNYINVGYVDVTNSYTPVATQYQDYSFQPATPTYVDQTSNYNHVGSYESVYSVAYATQPINVGSVYQPHAW